MTREQRYEYIRWSNNIRISKQGNEIVFKCKTVADFVKDDISAFMNKWMISRKETN